MDDLSLDPDLRISARTIAKVVRESGVLVDHDEADIDNAGLHPDSKVRQAGGHLVPEAQASPDASGTSALGPRPGVPEFIIGPLQGPGGRPYTGRAMKTALIHSEAPAWEAILRRVPHDFYHLPAYLALSADHEGGVARALLVDDGLRGMLLPLVIRPIPGGGLDAASPYGYPGPLTWGDGDPDFVREALVAGIEHLRSEGIVSLFVRLHPLLDEMPPVGVGRLVTHGETVSIDLSQSLEQIWGQTRNNHRRDIGKSERFGYVARADEAWEHFDTFVRLYRDTMERLSAEDRYLFDERYFRELRKALGPSGWLWVVTKGDTVAAAVLFVETSGIVQYHLAGTDAEHASARPSKLLIRTVTGWAKERGDLRLHLGGGVGGADDSLMHFKTGFSDERHAFRTLRIVVDNASYARLVAARDPELDPADLDGFFPLYRKT